MSFTASLTTYIQENLAGAGTPIAKDTSLIDGGILDSMGLMDVVLFVEQRTGVQVPDEEVVPENFQTVESIAQMVQRLQADRPVAPERRSTGPDS